VPARPDSSVREFRAAPALVVRRLGCVDYEPVWRDMQRFTAERDATTADELWLLEHPPVFTLGRNTKPEHLHDTGEIPVIQVDRGGQVTYHGPGQLIAYVLLDLRRRGLGVQSLVRLLEQSVIDLLAEYGIAGRRRERAPGVYVGERKIAALGLRVRRGCSFHGLSLNVDTDLAPFGMINPCGYRGLEVTRMSALGVDTPVERIATQLSSHIDRLLESSRT
jgi:lipoyl(octanoyl) transferase